jgi:hypothetical protein
MTAQICFDPRLWRSVLTIRPANATRNGHCVCDGGDGSAARVARTSAGRPTTDRRIRRYMRPWSLIQLPELLD